GRYTHPQLGVRIESAVGILDVTAHGGPLTTVTAEGNVTVADGTSERFCFAPEGCRCPSGETANAIQMNDRLMIFSFPPTRDGAHAEAIGRKWDPRRHCEKERDRRAASYGDPHIHTLDGLPVNVMTLGEFVNARDPEGGFELQTRHVDGGLP